MHTQPFAVLSAASQGGMWPYRCNPPCPASHHELHGLLEAGEGLGFLGGVEAIGLRVVKLRRS